ncbi:MAG: hypothetical protein AB4426_30005 [Xenococcaceae cyanobacterium]
MTLDALLTLVEAIAPETRRVSHTKSGLTTPFLKEASDQGTGTENGKQGVGEEKDRKLIKGVLDPIHW